jgi:hypothetical protein
MSILLDFITYLFMQVLLNVCSGRIGLYVPDVKHTDHQGHTTAASVSVASVGWTIIVLGELCLLEQER